MGTLLATAGVWAHASEQAPPPAQSHLTYIVPAWTGFLTADDSELAWQVARLRGRIGEGGGVKLGFSIFLGLYMQDWRVNLDSPEAVRLALGGFEREVDEAIRRARAHDIALSINLLTAIRSRTDAAQRASFEEDRRVMQWRDENNVADGWWTHSRYARRQYRVQRAYLREAAKILATRAEQFPDTLVAIAGDGEVELAPATDYSPFAVMEFRDWLRAEGLYAPGGPFAGEAYALADRYHGDASPAVDSNGDGHTLNGDLETLFTSWDLRFFHWSLADNEDADPNAIPRAVFGDPAFDPLPDAGPHLFDPPRGGQGSTSWNELWQLFRQTLVWHHNRDLARWMTTTPNDQGRTLPTDRWFSYQIPADHLWGSTPGDTNPRLLNSASPWWTANVVPFGGLGFTAFGARLGSDTYLRTLPSLLKGATSCGDGPASRPACLENAGGLAGATWGLFEWNPVVPLTEQRLLERVLESRRTPHASRTFGRATTEPGDHRIYDDEMRRLRRYRPRILTPFLWDDPDFRVLDSGFETALREFTTALRDGWTPSVGISPASLRFAARRAGGALVSLSGAQSVFVTQPTGGTVDWEAAGDHAALRVTDDRGHGDGAFTVALDPAAIARLPAGTHQWQVRVSAPGSVQETLALPVTVTLVDEAPTEPPFGLVDTPAQGATGVMGAVGITGWVLDDIGVEWVRLYRNCMAFEPAVHCQVIEGASVVYMGEATPVVGARPDVELLYPDYPQAHRAGWGYAMLTNLAPHVPTQQLSGGQGPLTLYARARDVEGHEAWLGRDFLAGSRTRTDGVPTGIALGNDSIAKPFGTIDVPAQGQIVSGIVGSFGWVLTPDADASADPDDILIPRGGSSLTLFIDGVPHARPVYNLCRGSVGSPPAAGQFCDDDVSNVFGNEVARPAGSPRTSNPTRFRNLDAGSGAIGGYWLDTTTLANGVHTIVWSAYDTAGRGDGLGSRYFTVLNTGAGDQGPGTGSVALSRRDTTDPRSPVPDPRPPADVLGRTGFSLDAPLVELLPDAVGIRHVQIDEMGRLELQFTGLGRARSACLAEACLGEGGPNAPNAGGLGPSTWLKAGEPALPYVVEQGYLVVNDEYRPLPVGSQFDVETGTFTWAPGVGFIGTYRLAFGQSDQKTGDRRQETEGAASRSSRDRVSAFTSGPRSPVPGPGKNLVLVDVTIRPASPLAPGEAALRMSLDAPQPGATVTGPFLVAGWALDPRAAIGSGIGAVHVWAQPTDVPGASPIFLGAAALDGPRPDVAGIYGAQFGNPGYNLSAPALPPGTYDLTSYVWNIRTARWEDARSVSVAAR